MLQGFLVVPQWHNGFSRGGHRICLWRVIHTDSAVEMRCFLFLRGIKTMFLPGPQARLQDTTENINAHQCAKRYEPVEKNMETLVMWVLARGQRKAFYILGGVESLVVYAYNYYLVTSCEVPLASASDRDELPHIPCLLIWVGKITLQHTSWFTGRHMTSYWSIWIIITRSVRTRCIFISLTPWISLDTVVAWPCQRIQPSALNQGELNALNKAHAG